MRVLVLLARRSTTVGAGFVIAAVEVWLALAARTPGLALWADLDTGLGISTLYTGALAAGFTAFEAGRWAPALRTRERAAARSLSTVRLVHAAACVGPLLAGYLAALLVLSLVAGTTGMYGAASLTRLVAVGCALILAAATGYVIGTTGSGRWWSAPSAALLFYAVYVAVRILPLPHTIRVLFPSLPSLATVFTSDVTATMLGLSAFWIGLAVLLPLLLVRRRRRTTSSLLILGLATIATVAGGGVALSQDGQYTTTSTAHDFICRSAGATICLNRGYVAAMQPLLNAVSQLNERAAGTPLVATRLEQNLDGDSPAPGARSIHIEQFAARDDLTFAMSRYVTEYGRVDRCTPTAPAALETVDTWLSGYSETFGQSPDAEHLNGLSRLPLKSANAWFRQHYRAYSTCTLTVDDLP